MDVTTFVRGATVGLAFLVELPAGTWAGTCLLKSGSGATVATLTVSLDALPAPDADGFTHAGLIEADSTETATWPTGMWLLDLRFADDAVPPNVVPSDPISVKVRQ